MFANQKVLVVGLARSGLAAAQILHHKGARVTGCDQKPEAVLGAVVSEMRDRGIEIIVEAYPEVRKERFDLLVASPGVPPDLPVFQAARDQGVPIIGELELAYRLKSDEVDMLAVTGTNGKTTTTSLLRYILEKDGRQAFYGGNIGVALTSLVENLKEGVIAVEVSSFQLETVDSFHPHISGILNITPDHLDRHKTMQAYIEAKARIFKCQTPRDYTVLNYDDALVRGLAPQCPGTVVFFSTQEPLAQGFVILDDQIAYQHHDRVIPICPIKDLRLRGRHNWENVLCAAAMSYLYGVRPAVIKQALKTFTGVRHRMEEVVTRQEILFVNDSKATNPESVMKALTSFEKPIILIAGGRNKGSDFSELANMINERVRELILLGEAREQIKRAVMNTPFRNIHEVNDLTEAVHTAVNLAHQGDVILLSPACASWDQFPSYEHRGDLFCQLARTLAEGSTAP